MLSWLVYTLATHPEKQACLTEEIDRMIPPGAKVEGDTVENMPYLIATVKETFRLLHLFVIEILQINFIYRPK